MTLDKNTEALLGIIFTGGPLAVLWWCYIFSEVTSYVEDDSTIIPLNRLRSICGDNDDWWRFLRRTIRETEAHLKEHPEDELHSTQLKAYKEEFNKVSEMLNRDAVV